MATLALDDKDHSSASGLHQVEKALYILLYEIFLPTHTHSHLKINFENMQYIIASQIQPQEAATVTHTLV